jgi:hypothetical protein
MSTDANDVVKINILWQTMNELKQRVVILEETVAKLARKKTATFKPDLDYMEFDPRN